jgi:putative transcriptional regulator
MDLKGTFLIAMPDLTDPNFHRTVVWVIDHDETGTVGLVINRSSALLNSTLCESQDIEWLGPDAHVHIGGPVRPASIWMVHGCDEPPVEDCHPICPGSWFSTDLDGLSQLASDAEGSRRIFGGYAGWGGGQLLQEIRVGAWLTCPSDLSLVFDRKPDEIWEASLAIVGVDPLSLVSGGGALQ